MDIEQRREGIARAIRRRSASKDRKVVDACQRRIAELREGVGEREDLKLVQSADALARQPGPEADDVEIGLAKAAPPKPAPPAPKRGKGKRGKRKQR